MHWHGNREIFTVFSGGGVSAEGMATKNKNQRGLDTIIERSQSRFAFTVTYLCLHLAMPWRTLALNCCNFPHSLYREPRYPPPGPNDKDSDLLDWFWLPIFRSNLVRGPWNKEMKFQNKGADLVQIDPLFISQPCNQSLSIVQGVRILTWGGWVSNRRNWEFSSYKAGGFRWYKTLSIWIWGQIFEFWRHICEFWRHVFEFQRQTWR